MSPSYFYYVATRELDATIGVSSTPRMSTAGSSATDGGVLVPSAIDILALVALVFVGSAVVRAVARRFSQPVLAGTTAAKKRLPKAQ